MNAQLQSTTARRASARRCATERRRHRRAGARRRRRGRACSAIPAARSCRSTTPCSATTLTHPRADGSEPMPLIVPANEQGAGFMAQGYARASGKVGVARGHLRARAPPTRSRRCATAMADSIPLVVICGQVPTAAIGTDAFQEAPISSIMGACAKHVFLVTDAAPARSDPAHRVRDGAQRPARAGGRGHPQGRAERRS